jgi:hypothetical protein
MNHNEFHVLKGLAHYKNAKELLMLVKRTTKAAYEVSSKTYIAGFKIMTPRSQ